MHVVANGIAPPVPVVRSHAGTETRIPVLLYLSNITRLKGMFVLIEALKVLSAEGLAFEARLAGAPGDAQTMQEFQEACAQTALSGRVAYLGVVVGDAKDRLFRSADIFTMPTLFDAFPLVALEAMAYGLPVVCSRKGRYPTSSATARPVSWSKKAMLRASRWRSGRCFSIRRAGRAWGRPAAGGTRRISRFTGWKKTSAPRSVVASPIGAGEGRADVVCRQVP